MKVTYLTAASVLIETKGVKILSDPWYADGAFYGSWHHWPPFQYDPKEFEDVDYIYISHIHEDHLCPETLNNFDKSIPILIHKFDSKFLKFNIEKLGFSTIEIEHGELFKLKNDINVRIYSVEKCTDNHEAKQSAIDTFMLVDDGDHVVVNTNDCMVNLIEQEVIQLKKQYPTIDMLLCCYTNASSYPQCTISLSEAENIREARRVKKYCYDKANRLIQILQPKYYMPFAGHYVLGGKLSKLNHLTANDSPAAGKFYFEETYPFSLEKYKCIVLNSKEHIDLKTGKVSKTYEHVPGLQKYITDVLSKVVFDYEKEEHPNKKQVYDLFEDSYSRMENNRKRLNFETDTKVFIYLLDDEALMLDMSGDGYKIVNKNDIDKYNKYVTIKMDLRLLYKILQGPRFAHWDNADGGSHIFYEKKPNVFERGIYHTICFFHR